MANLGIPIFRRSAAGLDVPAHGRFETDDRTPSTWAGSNLYTHPMLSDPLDAAANPFNFGDNANKAVRVNVVAGAAAGGTSSAFSAAFPASGTAAGARGSTGNMEPFNLDVLGQLKVVLPAGAGGLTDAELRASAVPVSVAALPLPAGAATEATLAGVLTTAAFQARINTLGQKAMAASTPVVLASDQSAIPVTVAALPLPAGAATEATLAALSAKLPAALVGGRLDVNLGASGITLAISAAALPLPAGAATEATLATRLADATFTARINTLGQKAMAASTPVVLASDQSAIPVTGTFWQATQPISAAALPLPAGAATEATLATRLADATFTARINTQGQKAMAASTPVVIASDQSAIPISAAALPLPAGAATEATLSAMSAKLPAALVGGRLDTNVGAWLGSTAPTVAQKVMASSVPVVIASDQTAIPVNGDIDHDVANTLKNIQIAGHASPVDVPPAAVSANGDRVRAWLDRFGAQVVRRRKIRETYTIVFRLAEAAGRLDQTFTHVANTNKQWATLHHTAGATKEVRLQQCICWITAATAVAPLGILEIRQITTAPVTGNPAITPTARRRGGTAAEAVALYLPTTAGTDAAVNQPLAHMVFDDAVSVATAALQHPQTYNKGGIMLFDASQEDDEAMQPVLPVATLDGWAVVTRMVGATVMRMTVLMVITEEIP